MYNKSTKKIIHVIIIIVIIFAVFCVAGVLALKYQVEGEANLPFEITKISIIESVEGIENSGHEERWNFNVNQNNDIYIQIQKNDQYKQNSNIKNITFENFNIQKNNGNGAEKIKLYRANSEGKIVEDDAHLVNNTLNYKGAKENNLDSLEILNQGGIILLRSVNQNVCEVRNNDESIIHDGTLLAKGNVNPEDLKYTLTFDIIIETNRNIKYKGTVSLVLPTGNIETEGKSQMEKTDFSDVIFKRI